MSIIKRYKKLVIAFIAIILCMSLFAGCKKDNTKPPVVNNTEFEIEKVQLENRVNHLGRVTYEKVFDVEYEGNEVEYFGEKLVATIQFTDNLPLGESITTSDLTKVSVEDIIKQANSDLDLVIDINKNILKVTIKDNIEETYGKSYELVIPSTIQSDDGIALKEGKNIKLKLNPHTFVKAVNKSTKNPLYFDGIYNSYYTNIEEGSNFTFYLQFNNDVDKAEVFNKVKEACSGYSSNYKWINDRELKVFLPNQRSDKEIKIDLSSVLDVDGERIYTSPKISILVGK